jgi:hypothetical protein
VHTYGGKTVSSAAPDNTFLGASGKYFERAGRAGASHVAQSLPALFDFANSAGGSGCGVYQQAVGITFLPKKAGVTIVCELPAALREGAPMCDVYSPCGATCAPFVASVNLATADLRGYMNSAFGDEGGAGNFPEPDDFDDEARLTSFQLYNATVRRGVDPSIGKGALPGGGRNRFANCTPATLASGTFDFFAGTADAVLAYGGRAGMVSRAEFGVTLTRRKEAEWSPLGHIRRKVEELLSPDYRYEAQRARFVAFGVAPTSIYHGRAAAAAISAAAPRYFKVYGPLTPFGPTVPPEDLEALLNRATSRMVDLFGGATPSGSAAAQLAAAGVTAGYAFFLLPFLSRVLGVHRDLGGAGAEPVGPLQGKIVAQLRNPGLDEVGVGWDIPGGEENDGDAPAGGGTFPLAALVAVLRRPEGLLTLRRKDLAKVAVEGLDAATARKSGLVTTHFLRAMRKAERRRGKREAETAAKRAGQQLVAAAHPPEEEESQSE